MPVARPTLPVGYTLLTCLCFLLPPGRAAQEPEPPRLVIYPGNLTLVEEVRTVALPAGHAEVRVDFLRGNADVTSLDAVPLDHFEEVRVTSVRRRTHLPNAVFLQVESQAAVTERLRLSYAVKGFSAQVRYEVAFEPAAGTLDLRQLMEVANSSGEPFDRVAVHSVFGSVKTVQPGVVLHGRAPEPAAGAPPGLKSEPLRQDFAEHTLISFGEPLALSHGVSVRRPTLVKEALATAIEYRIDSQAGPVAKRILKVPNQEGAGLGGVTLQPGSLFLVERDTEAGERFVSAGALPHVPPGKELEIDAGPVADLAVKRELRELKRTDLVFGEYNRALISYSSEETWWLEVRNHSGQARAVVVLERIAGGAGFEVLESSHPPTKKDKATLEFRFELPAQQTLELRYRVKKVKVQP